MVADIQANYHSDRDVLGSALHSLPPRHLSARPALGLLPVMTLENAAAADSVNVR